MRILIATPHRNVVGGVERYLQSIIPALSRRGHKLAVLHRYRLNATEETIDAQAEQLPSWCAAESPADEILGSVAAWAPDVIYSQGLDDLELENALLGSYRNVLYAHSYYGTCISGTKCHRAPQLEPCGRRLGAECLLLYFPRRCGGLDPRTMWRMFRSQSERRASLSAYETILAASSHMCREYERHSAQRVRLVPLPMTGGIPKTGTPLRKSPGNRILFLGRMLEVKGLSHLIRAVPEASRCLGRALAITVAGDGPGRPQVERLAGQLRVPVDFAGWIGSERKLELIRQSDLLAVPSLWPEPFGLVGIEAGRLGVPAVGYAVGGIPDWLIAGQTGEIAPADPPSPDGLAAAIVRALADPDHYNRLCYGAWLKSNEYTLERHLDQLEAVLCPRQATETPACCAPTAAF